MLFLVSSSHQRSCATSNQVFEKGPTFVYIQNASYCAQFHFSISYAYIFLQTIQESNWVFKVITNGFFQTGKVRSLSSCDCLKSNFLPAFKGNQVQFVKSQQFLVNSKSISGLCVLVFIGRFILQQFKKKFRDFIEGNLFFGNTKIQRRSFHVLFLLFFPPRPPHMGKQSNNRRGVNFFPDFPVFLGRHIARGYGSQLFMEGGGSPPKNPFLIQ